MDHVPTLVLYAPVPPGAGALEKAHDVSQEARDERGRWRETGIIVPEEVIGKEENPADRLLPEKRPHIFMEAFQAWFGPWQEAPEAASKVVDHHGTPQETWEFAADAASLPERALGEALPEAAPKLVFHGSVNPQGFREFDPTRIGLGDGMLYGPGFYFTEDPRVAAMYPKGAGAGGIMACYLNVRNPFDADNVTDEQAEGIARWFAERFGFDAAGTANLVANSRRQPLLAWRELSQQTTYSTQALQALGYDGITAMQWDAGGPTNYGREGKLWNRIWVAFAPEQIKSVANTGGFDSNEADIFKAARAELRAGLASVAWEVTPGECPGPALCGPTRPAVPDLAPELPLGVENAPAGLLKAAEKPEKADPEAEDDPEEEPEIIWCSGRNGIAYPHEYRRTGKPGGSGLPTLHPIQDPSRVLALSQAGKGAKKAPLRKAEGPEEELEEVTIFRFGGLVAQPGSKNTGLEPGFCFAGHSLLKSVALETLDSILDPLPAGPTALRWFGEWFAKAHFSPSELKQMQLRWITAHPNGPGTDGIPLLVHDNGDHYVVVGGAGGKLNQTKLSKTAGKSPEEVKAARGKAEEQRKAQREKQQQEDPEAFKKIDDARKAYAAKAKSELSAYHQQAMGMLGVDLEQVANKAHQDAAAEAQKNDAEITPEEVGKIGTQAAKNAVRDAHAAVDSALRGALDAVARAKLNNQAPEAQDVQALVAGTQVAKTLDPQALQDLLTKSVSIQNLQQTARTLAKSLRTGKAPAEIGVDMAALEQEPDPAEVERLLTAGYLTRQSVSTQNDLVKESQVASPAAQTRHQVLGGLDALNSFVAASTGSAILDPGLGNQVGVEGMARIAAAHLRAANPDPEWAAQHAAQLGTKLSERSDLHAGAALALAKQLDGITEAAVKASQSGDGTVTTASAHLTAMENQGKKVAILNQARGQVEAASRLHQHLLRPSAEPLAIASAETSHALRMKARALNLEIGDFSIDASKARPVLLVHADALHKLAQPAPPGDAERALQMQDLKEQVAASPGWRSPNQAPGVELSPHQELAARGIVEGKRLALNYGAGSGKTAIYHTAADALLSSGKCKRGIMTMPAKPRSQQMDYEEADEHGTKQQYTGEVSKFLAPAMAQKFATVESTADLQQKLAEVRSGKTSVLIMSPEMLRTHQDLLLKEGFGGPDSFYFADEAHELAKSAQEVGAARKAAQGGAAPAEGEEGGGSGKAQAAQKIAGGSGWFAAGTGTAIENGADELHGLLHLVSPDAFPRGQQKGFQQQWERAALVGKDAMFGDEAIGGLAAKVNPYMLSYHSPPTTKDAAGADRPLQQTKTVEKVPLTAEQRHQIRQANEDFTQASESTDPNVRAGAAFRRYAAIRKAQAGEGMLQAVKRMLDEKVRADPSFKAVIWSQTLDPLHGGDGKGGLQALLAEHSPTQITGANSDVDTKRACRDFNQGGSHACLVSNAANFGVNLQGGHEIWKLFHPDVASKDEQLDARVHRRGQTRDTVSRTFIGDHPTSHQALFRVRQEKGRSLALLASLADDSGMAATLATRIQELQAAAGRDPSTKTHGAHQPRGDFGAPGPPGSPASPAAPLTPPASNPSAGEKVAKAFPNRDTGDILGLSFPTAKQIQERVDRRRMQTLHAQLQTALRNVPRPVRLLKAGHDVSTEPRDAAGKWTQGGGATATALPAAADTAPPDPPTAPAARAPRVDRYGWVLGAGIEQPGAPEHPGGILSAHGDLPHDLLRGAEPSEIEPSWNPAHDNKARYGGVLVNEHGQFLLRKPTGEFMGWRWSFPKGGMDPGEHPVDTALREVAEESAHHTQVIGTVPDERIGKDGSSNRYFLMRPLRENSEMLEHHTEEYRWATYTDAVRMLQENPFQQGRAERAVLDRAAVQLPALWDEIRSVQADEAVTNEQLRQEALAQGAPTNYDPAVHGPYDPHHRLRQMAQDMGWNGKQHGDLDLDRFAAALQALGIADPRTAGAPAPTGRAARKLLQDRIVERFLQPRHPELEPLYQTYADTADPRPVAVLMFGAPGSGKSTVAEQRYLSQHRFVQVDTDEVKQFLPGYDPAKPETVHHQSNPISDRILDQAIKGQRPFVMDGTGTNESWYREVIRRARDAGYHVVLCKVDVGVETAMRRNRQRSRSVPEALLREKHAAVDHNFARLLELADHHVVIDNDAAEA